MTQQIVDVGHAPKDGMGDPIRDSFIKVNSNDTELYARTDALAAKDLQLTSVIATGSTTERSYADRFAETVNVLDFGVTPAAADNTAAFTAAFTSAMNTGRRVRVPSGTYLIGATVDMTLTGDLEIELDQKAVIKGKSGFSTPILDFDGAGLYSFTMRGGSIDSSVRGFIDSAQSGTCLNLDNMREFLVDGARIVAAANYWSETPQHGDTGISYVTCASGRIVNCYFRGHPDIAVYGSGGASSGLSDDGGSIIVANNHFDCCYVGISFKRQMPRAVVQGNTFTRCNFGVSFWEAASSGTYLLPGDSSIVSGNTFKFTQASAINLQNTNGLILTNNLIEDFGVTNSDGTTPVIGYGIKIGGAVKTIISGNLIRMKDWTNNSDKYGILIQNFTMSSPPGGAYTASENTIANNKIVDVYFGVYESPGVGLNQLAFNRITGATTKYTLQTTPYSDLTDTGTTFSSIPKVASGIMLGPMHPGYIATHWYLPPNVTGGTGAACTLGNIRLHPIWIYQPCTISDLGIRTTTPGGNVQLAIYASHPTTFEPTGPALGSTGSINVSGAASVYSGALTSAVSITTPGLYWFALNSDNSALVCSIPFTSLLNAYLGDTNEGNVPGNASTYSLGYTHTETYGTWANVTAYGWSKTINAFAMIHFKVSSVP